MMRMKCEVIQDLLPLYCDGQASEESCQLIEEHLEECAGCRETYQAMKEPEQDAGLFEQTNIKKLEPLKKIRKDNRRNVIVAVLISAAVLLTAFGFIFKNGVIGQVADSSDVKVTTKASQIDEEVDGKKTPYYMVDIVFELQNGKCLSARADRDLGTVGKHELTLYEQMKIPFDDRGKHPGRYTYGVGKDSPFTEKDKVKITFADETVEYDLKEIAEEADIQ